MSVANMPRPRLRVDRLERKDVPPRALVISLGALAIPVLAAFTANIPEQFSLLLWLIALVPAFLLAYYKGWTGVAVAMAVGMALITSVNVLLLMLGRTFDDPMFLFGVVVTYLGIGVGVGISSEMLHLARDEAAARAMQDTLTGLANRRFADVIMNREFAAAQRGRNLCFVLFDLDRFKQINDTHGHHVGDQALKLFASALSSNTRTMNLSARLGGDEFISILSGSDPAGALVYVRRVQETLAGSPLPYGPLLVSAGVAPHVVNMESVSELYEAADQALYRAKALGSGQVCVYGREDQET